MSRLRLWLALVLGLAATASGAQTLTGLARIATDGSSLVDSGGGVELRLSLTVAVPYRVFTLDNPRRVILDFNEVDWRGFAPAEFDRSAMVKTLRVGIFQPGWSRMVLDIDRPMAVETAALSTSGNLAQVLVRLVPVSGAEFSNGSGAPDGARFTTQTDAGTSYKARQRQTGERPLVVVLDPGHGGIDPGAEHGSLIEADLMLAFARELKEILLRAGNFDVVLTREADVFVPLESRVSIARRAGADVFLSLHADALVEGRASGATIYTLSQAASDIASQKLAERHDRADLLAGVDLSQQDDVIASVLMDMARTETAPRSDKLAARLVSGLSATVGVHKRPRLSAGFSVLKAPDIPSVLLELGFLSSPRDRKGLRDPDWRQRAAKGIRNALQLWAVDDAADALLLRK